MSTKKMILINISGIYLISVAIIILFLVGFSSVMLFVAMKSPKFADRPAPVPLALLPSLIPTIWCFLTGIGILKKKNSARYSLIVLSIFALLISIPLFAASIKVPVFLAIPVIFFVAIPVFFIIFFNKKDIKSIFTSEIKPEEIKRPIGITIIACLNLLTLTSLLTLFINPKIKLAFFGMVFPDTFSIFYYIVISILHLYLAIGFFRLIKSSWYVYIVTNVFYLLAGIVNIFGLTENEMREILASMSLTASKISISHIKASQTFGLIMGALLLIYVIFKRKYFNVNSQK